MNYINIPILVLILIRIIAYLRKNHERNNLDKSEEKERVKKIKKNESTEENIPFTIVNRQRNKDYLVSKKIISSILKYLDNKDYKIIFYVGYADKNLILSLKDKYELRVSDWYDKTNTSLHFWEENEELRSKYPVPDWIDNVRCQIEGIPLHDVLLIDLPVEWNFKDRINNKMAKLVFVFGDADSCMLPNDYKWTYDNVWIGVYKNE